MSPNRKFEELLIEGVRQHDVLFNLANRNYKNVLLKDKIWEELAKTLGSSGDLCRKKWKGLRDTYKRSKRTDNLHSSAVPAHKKKWRYQDKLKFLDSVPDFKPTKVNVDKDVDKDVGAEVVECKFEVIMPEDMQAELSDSTYSPTPRKSRDNRLSKNRGKDDEFSEFLQAASEYMTPVPATEHQETVKFYEYIAARVCAANLTDVETVELESEVQTVVLRAIKRSMEKQA